MKIKLFKIHAERTYDVDGYEDIIRACIDSESEWEEVSDEDYYTIVRWARESENKKEGYSFAVATEPRFPVKECIDEQMKREKVRMEREKKIEEERKLAYKKREKAAKLKKLEKLKKELTKLENER